MSETRASTIEALIASERRKARLTALQNALKEIENSPGITDAWVNVNNLISQTESCK